jgi:hypothetical protein
VCVVVQADPKLKGKIQADELGAMFGNIKPLTTFHTNLLKQLESVGAKYAHLLPRLSKTILLLSP